VHAACRRLDLKSPVFGTSETFKTKIEGVNDISKLPTAFTRAERFDGIFFVDIPDRTAKDQIWKIYEQEYGLEMPKRPDDTD